ncbi:MULTISPECIES: hypothetical protein [Micromonospora]|nr:MULTISPECIES: hypothetical protein [Micromonospora]
MSGGRDAGGRRRRKQVSAEERAVAVALTVVGVTGMFLTDQGRLRPVT